MPVAATALHRMPSADPNPDTPIERHLAVGLSETGMHCDRGTSCIVGSVERRSEAITIPSKHIAVVIRGR